MRAGPHPHSLDSNDDACRHTASSTSTQKLTNRTITAATTIHGAPSGQQRRPSFAPQGADELWGIAHLVTCAFDNSPTSTAPTPTPRSTLHRQSQTLSALPRFRLHAVYTLGSTRCPRISLLDAIGSIHRASAIARPSHAYPARSAHVGAAAHMPSPQALASLSLSAPVHTVPSAPPERHTHITAKSRTGWAGEREKVI
ncbi:hypothetical protein BJ912DRAFT_1118723 [Pholiota molesta]|nr:hypothetical protein BJ912DRAFT_1061048 [Pholiota molesta]KAF8184201.1 hypothetical protein BJ912DRAFT_1118723 [Pholiota molesta]